MIQLMFLKVHPCCLLFSLPFLNGLVQTPLDRDDQAQLPHGVWNSISDLNLAQSISMWMARVMAGSCLTWSVRARAGGGKGFHRGLQMPSQGSRAQVQWGKHPYGRATWHGRAFVSEGSEAVTPSGVREPQHSVKCVRSGGWPTVFPCRLRRVSAQEHV